MIVHGNISVPRRPAPAESSIHDEGKPLMNMNSQPGAAVQMAAVLSGNAEFGQTEA